jgi:hypothetical protein
MGSAPVKQLDTAWEVAKMAGDTEVMATSIKKYTVTSNAM